ncbi:acetoacetate decarboxylase family protein [Paenibacillus sp. DCT19]|uniref:acetoacetate decarboxylase family protein n=1 Tax=Paenibacillus sp. DCT19 TaxID=2211212 RepID=UPI000FE1F946|nr:acetoacetate decarboxylase family protein [Paenibacillus sp. DCT19]
MNHYPAPWQLQGSGYILIYRFTKEFVTQHGRVPAFLEGQFSGGLGSVMLVNYESSDAGPYGELLFIPGKFQHQGRKLNTISKIYVSTSDSVDNGWENWGIPKELAAFSFQKLASGKEHVQVSQAGVSIADLTLSAFGPSFPVNTRLLPFPLVQQHQQQWYYTQFSGKGKGRLAKIDELSINAALFPDISLCKPWAVLKVDPFAITFPVTTIQK